jgi:hypothetical protein
MKSIGMDLNGKKISDIDIIHRVKFKLAIQPLYSYKTKAF